MNEREQYISKRARIAKARTDLAFVEVLMDLGFPPDEAMARIYDAACVELLELKGSLS